MSQPERFVDQDANREQRESDADETEEQDEVESQHAQVVVVDVDPDPAGDIDDEEDVLGDPEGGEAADRSRRGDRPVLLEEQAEHDRCDDGAGDERVGALVDELGIGQVSGEFRSEPM